MKKHIITIIVLMVALLIVVPLVWFIIDSTNLLSIIGIMQSNATTPSNWTSVLLGYFGSALAAILGYTAVIITIFQQEKARREDNAKEVLPLIAAEPYYGAVSKPVVVTNSDCEAANLNVVTGGILKVQNVGMREMYNLEIISLKSDKFDDVMSHTAITPILYKENSVFLCVYPVIEGALDGKNVCIQGQAFKAHAEISLFIDVTFAYQDCYKNIYTQDFRLTCISRLNLPECHDNTAVYIGTTIEHCDIVDAPKLLSQYLY